MHSLQYVNYVTDSLDILVNIMQMQVLVVFSFVFKQLR
jgi:hypothetical protein